MFAAKKYLFVIRVEVIIFLLHYSDAGNNVIVKLATRISLKSSTKNPSELPYTDKNYYKLL